MNINQPSRALGPAAARVLAFIRAYITEHGYAPLLSEIQHGSGFSGHSGAQYHVERLERLGLLDRGPRGAHRGITLTEVPA